MSHCPFCIVISERRHADFKIDSEMLDENYALIIKDCAGCTGKLEASVKNVGYMHGKGSLCQVKDLLDSRLEPSFEISEDESASEHDCTSMAAAPPTQKRFDPESGSPVTYDEMRFDLAAKARIVSKPEPTADELREHWYNLHIVQPAPPPPPPPLASSKKTDVTDYSP